jgi:hypothetical protein
MAWLLWVLYDSLGKEPNAREVMTWDFNRAHTKEPIRIHRCIARDIDLARGALSR